MSSNRLGEAEYLGLRLFLEGVEVPVVSATVDINEGSAASAQIELVGLDSALRILPRTVVHLFFFDGPAYNHDGLQSKNPDNYYKLLFMGEVFSYTFQKTGQGSRAVILNCTDFSNYWDTSYLFQVSGEQGFLDIPQTQPFITGSEVFAENIVTQNMGFLISTISNATQLDQTFRSKNSVSSDFLTKLFGFLELLGGVSVIDDSAKQLTRESAFGGMSLWHTISERRVRLLDQIGVDSGETAAQLFEETKFYEFLKNQTDMSSPVLSFRDILNMLLGHIYYSHFPNPCGRITQSDFTAHPVVAGGGGGGSGLTFKSGVKVPHRGAEPPNSKNTTGDYTLDDAFYNAVLAGVGAKPTPEKRKFFYAWRIAEGGFAHYNPFNTTQPSTGSTRYNEMWRDGKDTGAGVRNYVSQEAGIAATVATLKLRYYTAIIDALKRDNLTALQIAEASRKAFDTWKGEEGGGYVEAVLRSFGSYKHPQTIARDP